MLLHTVDGQRQWVTIGQYPTVTLGKAREAVRTLWTCRALVERHWLIRRHVFRTKYGLMRIEGGQECSLSVVRLNLRF